MAGLLDGASVMEALHVGCKKVAALSRTVQLEMCIAGNLEVIGGAAAARGNGLHGVGSITAFYTVLSEGDDQQDPIADAARAAGLEF